MLANIIPNNRNQINDIDIINDKIKGLENEIKELQIKIREEKILIKRYSFYDINVISNIICELINTFEGTLFVIDKRTGWFNESPRLVIKSNNSIYNDIKFDIVLYDNNKTLLMPLKYIDANFNEHKRLNVPNELKSHNYDYIEDFINKLYYYRLENKLDDLSEIELRDFLHEYLRKNKNSVMLRKEIKERYVKECMILYLEKTRKIERFSFISSIIDIINDNDNPYYAEVYLKKISDNNELSILHYFHVIDIKKLEIASFSSIRGQTLYSFVFENMNEAYNRIFNSEPIDEYINFYEFKTSMKCAMEVIPELNDYIKGLENTYKDKDVITRDDIINYNGNYNIKCRKKIK